MCPNSVVPILANKRHPDKEVVKLLDTICDTSKKRQLLPHNIDEVSSTFENSLGISFPNSLSKRSHLAHLTLNNICNSRQSVTMIGGSSSANNNQSKLMHQHLWRSHGNRRHLTFHNECLLNYNLLDNTFTKQLSRVTSDTRMFIISHISIVSHSVTTYPPTLSHNGWRQWLQDL